MGDRWVEVTPSQFSHEAEGLKVVRDLMPDRGPFRAWTNFEFRDDRGTWSEVDLLLLCPDGLHLVELKYYAGRLRGTDQTWLRDGRAPVDSPLLLANRKAKRLRSKLMAAYREWARGRRFDTPPPAPDVVIPFIRESVFLHHPDFVCELPHAAHRDLYGLPGQEARSGLAPISDLLTRAGSRPLHESAIVGVMGLIGVRAHAREAGSYVLDAHPLADGPGWQDWLGTHKHLRGQRRRLRFRVVPEGSPEEARRRVRLLAAHEMHVMQRLSHDAILRPEDFVDSELGPGLIYPYDPAWQRLDLWLAARPPGLSFDVQVDLVRQIAEAVQYAHGKHVVHRGLGPRAVLVRPDRNGRPRVALTDWQGVGRTDEATATPATRGVTALAASGPDMPVGERWAHEGFAAPEGLTGAPDRLRLDVFGLGALAFYLVTGGRPPARTRSDLIARLRSQGGLDVSVELPEAPPALREAILAATNPRVSDRLPDVAAFLAKLDEATRVVSDEITDPLAARPGAVLDGRFALLNRLGAGSTAVGLLVTDAAAPDAPPRVLKVSVDDAAARRLEDEADALRRLKHPRIVRLIDGPFDVGGRRALLLSNAGPETLATHLGNRERLSLDLLERWGGDLLETLGALDAAGIAHRDIKPANLGVKEDRANNSNRSKHLVLFDFSLTRAAASDTQAGTRPYLDPFLTAKRPYDSAAERYAAAVVLFEMATGHPPVYGDGLSDPASINDEATIEPAELDPSARAHLAAFFTKALARDAQARHHTAEEMLQAWRACFPESSVPPQNADALAAAATPDTPLTQAGLTPRAISALEQWRVATVGELAAIDAVRLNRMPGVAKPTRDEIKARAKAWRARFGRRARGVLPADGDATLPAPHDAAQILLDAARGGRQDKAVTLASHLLGVTGTLDANATQPELAASLKPPVTRGRVSQLMTALQERWATDQALELLDQLSEAVDARLAELGGVATHTELARHLLTLMLPHRPADAEQTRLAEGLLRCTIDRRAAKERAEEGDTDEGGWFLRRRPHRPLIVASRHDLLDVAEALGRRADTLVDEANPTGTAELVPATRVAAELGAVLDRAEEAAPTRAASPYDGLRDDRRLARLAAGLAERAGASAKGELHHTGLPAAQALRHTLTGVAPGQRYPAEELRDRVAARFPDLPELPTRPDLDQVVAQAGIGLRFDEDARAYAAPAPTGGDTTGLERRQPTLHPTHTQQLGPGAVGQRLLDSRQRRSFIALGVAPQRLDALLTVLRDRFDAVELDLSAALLDALHAAAAAANIPWSTVLDADADAPGSRAQTGLNALVSRALPQVRAAIEQALAAAGDRPVALVDAALLARFDALGELAPWLDLATPRPTAVWLVVPQLPASWGALVDGRPLPLTAPSQFVTVPLDWIDLHRPAPEGAPA